MGAGQGQMAGDRRQIGFFYNGSRVTAFEGDSVACALVRAGVHTFSRSMKFHRPRGLYCGTGRCISCVMRVNGVPGVRTCTLPAAEGMVVESQGGLPSANHDILSVLDHIFRKEFEYQRRFIRPRFMTPLYQRMVRHLAAPAHIPSGDSRYPQLSRRNCRAIVIGQGVSGSVASARLRGADLSGVVVVDSMHVSQERIPSVAFGIYEAGEVGVLTNDSLQIIRPEVTLLATGRNETGLPLVNADLAGVMLPGAVAQLAMRGVAPGRNAVVIGNTVRRQAVLRDLNSLGVAVVREIDDPSQVKRIAGNKRVKGVDLRSSSTTRKRIACDTVVLLGPLVPSVDLAQQAGCELVPREGAFVIKTDSSGQTSVPSIFACGSVAGSGDHSERISSAERAAESIIKRLGVR